MSHVNPPASSNHQGRSPNTMVRCLRAAVKLFTKINLGVGTALSYTLIMLTLLILMEIVLRYIFKSPTIWSYDVSLWLFGMPAMLGGGYVLAKRSHVNMDLFYSRFSPRGKAIIDALTSVMFFAFVCVLVYQGLKFAQLAITRQEMTIGSWQVKAWPLKICMPIAASLLFLQGIADFIRNAYLAITGKELVE